MSWNHLLLVNIWKLICVSVYSCYLTSSVNLLSLIYLSAELDVGHLPVRSLLCGAFCSSLSLSSKAKTLCSDWLILQSQSDSR